MYATKPSNGTFILDTNEFDYRSPNIFTNLCNGICWSHINKKVSLKFFFLAYASDAIYAEILFSS